MNEPRRLGVVASHPVQYLVPVWRRLAERRDVDVTVYYASDQGARPYFDAGFGREVAWDVPLLDGYRYRVLENRPLKRLGWRFDYRCPTIADELARDEIDALLLVGKEFWYYNQALRAAFKQRIPVLYRADTPPPNRHPIKRWIAERQRRTLFQRFEACLCLGHDQEAFYRSYGVDASRLFFAPYSADDKFRDEAASGLHDRAALRERFGLPRDAAVALYMAKFSPVKRPMDLLRAYARYADGDRFGLLMAGEGPLLDECRATVREHRLPNVVFPGFMNQSEVGAAYAAADCLALPSQHETWGMVVNEAMTFGLPVVVSDQVTCRHDLVTPANGAVHPVGDDRALAEALVHVLGANRRVAMGRASREIIEGYAVDVTVDGIVGALRGVPRRQREARPPRMGSFAR